MSDLIKIEKGTPLLDPLVAEKIVKFETAMKQLKKQEDELKEAILKEMEANHLVKLDTDDLSIIYVAGTDRETFDSKEFKKDNPDLYDEYVKITPVKSSIRLKVK